MEETWSEAVAGLAAEVEGVVAVPGEPGYEVADQLFNAATRQRPAVVVRVRSVADVQAAVRFAAARSLPVAVQATGHGVVVPADDAVLISTRDLRGVNVDAATRTARLEAGVRSGELIAAATEVGLAPVNGASPLVGTVGYTLGGGIGPLGRPYGYAVDHVRELEMVLADGSLVTASPAQHPDLFWAARGGKDNFGVVTAMVTDLVPVSRLYGGGIYFPGESTAELLGAYREWVATVPDEMTSSVALLRLPPIEELPEPLRGKYVVHLRIAYTGSEADGEELVRPLREVAPALIDTVREMPYAEVATIHNDPTEPAPLVECSAVLRSLEPETVDVLLSLAGPAVDVPLVVVELRHLGGALARPPARPSAIGHRDAEFSVFMGSVVFGPEDAARECQARLVEALNPWRVGPYVSFLTASQTAQADTAAAFEPADYERLRQVKATYDPENRFRINNNIPPG
jgi:FAD/FMN-containing dehydrogenase